MDLPATENPAEALEVARRRDALFGQAEPQQEEQRVGAGRQGPSGYARTAEGNPRSAADARRRLMQDLKRIQCSSNPLFSARPIDGDLFHWRAVVLGPDSTVWEGGVFKLRLDFTEEYPCAPPKVRFLTKDMFHPNVYVDGNVCLDTLKNAWSPTLDVESLLMMIISFLSDPNPNSAANGEAALLYTTAKDKYDERVRRLVEASLDQSFSDAEDE
ncbi:ubiquitin-conjugating enzyme E2 [Trypanosoma conorhini]|uniref:Ubiquitin-conjugating enzyme E2 n=1 Tax=Trypanosoma conorhini TaxID=83891 RepID=A0A3R7PJX3_9TRYP|nr:ubiquitin-conjugating enzyme E2 [Trypanosoma conorhini]RNF26425.1 ubiquitin-conjugating enzyme E2 [Trypanosoma conorhini]